MIASILMLLTTLVGAVYNLLFWVMVVHAILSWVIAFSSRARRNNFVSTVYSLSDQIMSPIYAKIRKVFPFLTIGALDLSPLAVIFIGNVVLLVMSHLAMAAI